MNARRRTEPLARYTDRQGRRHRIVRRGALVLDLSAQDVPRVVAELVEGEGEEQVSPLVLGQGGEEGYVARMAREPGPICRALRPADVEQRAGRGADRARSNRGEQLDGRRAA